jgi:hypothetical protein
MANDKSTSGSISLGRRAELLRQMEGRADDEPVLFILGWGTTEITCGEMRELLAALEAQSKLAERYRITHVNVDGVWVPTESKEATSDSGVLIVEGRHAR